MKKKLLFVMLVYAMLITACGNKETKNDMLQGNESEVNTEIVSDTEIQSTEIVSSETEVLEQPQNNESDVPATGETVTPPVSENTGPSTSAYTYTELNKTMYAKSAVNVRDLPSLNGNKLGGLDTAQEVKVTGQCNETSWYRIEYNG